MPANTIPQYLWSTNMLPMQQAPPTQQISIHLVKRKSVARAILKTMMKESDVTTSARQAMGKKLHKILIKAKGDVNACYEGKNAWDEVMRMLIPQILDISVVEREGHKLKSIKKLRAILDKEFENEDNELSIIGLKNAEKRMVEDRMKHVEILIPER
jgi:hypothetical protein